MAGQLDRIDVEILRLLQDDGKRKIKDIATELNMSNTPIYERIKRLEREKYILKYSTIVDRRKLGYSIMAYTSVRLEKQNTEGYTSFKEAIQGIKGVIECYQMAGQYDFLLKVVVEDMGVYESFITKELAAINVIGQISTSFVLEEVKNNHSTSDK